MLQHMFSLFPLSPPPLTAFYRSYSNKHTYDDASDHDRHGHAHPGPPRRPIRLEVERHSQRPSYGERYTQGIPRRAPGTLLN